MIGPAIFISAVTAEHKTTRQRIANVLTRLDFQPVWQDVFGTEQGDLRKMLQDKIDECEGLIHLAGHAYGAEPPTVDVNSGRVSYTQFEFLYARQCGKKTWLIFPGPACTRDTAFEQLDLPVDPATPDPTGYQAERRQLQATYRENLRNGSGHLWYEPANDSDLELKIERLRNEFAELRRGFQLWQKKVLVGIAVLAFLVACVLGGFVLQQHLLKKLHNDQQVTAGRIRAQLVDASKRRYDDDIAQAVMASSWEVRQNLKDAAESAYKARLARIDDMADSFAQLEGGSTATAVFKEMTRILREEGVEAALAFVEHNREDLLVEAQSIQASAQEQVQAKLLPILVVTEMHEAKGQADLALKDYQDLLSLEPGWPDLLHGFASFLWDQSLQAQSQGRLSNAFADARQSVELAKRLNASPMTKAEWQRLLVASLDRIADVLVERGQADDDALALTNYTDSLELAERLVKSTPSSLQAERDMSVSLEKLGDFLARPGQPGDAALTDYARCLEVRERLLKLTTNSPQAKRDAVVILNKLGDCMAKRGESGNAKLAFANYTRSLALAEDLIQDSPDRQQAVRDLSVTLVKLGDFLAKRGQTGDDKLALIEYTRNLALLQNLLDTTNSPQALHATWAGFIKLGDFLAERRQAGDDRMAVTNYTYSLALAERFLKAYTESSQAVTDVELSHLKLASSANLLKIQHFVVLMLEGRSFDNLFGYLKQISPGVAGLTGSEYCNFPDPLTRQQPPVHVTPTAGFVMPFDPPHEFWDVQRQLYGPDPGRTHGSNLKVTTALMNGFLYCGNEAASAINGIPNQGFRVMECFQPNEIPVLTALAQQFALFNHWHSSLPGPAWPNRFFIHAATSGGLSDSPATEQIVAGFSFKNGTIYDRLTAAGKGWRIYHDGLPQCVGINSLRSEYVNPFIDSFRNMNYFSVDVAADNLPEYTFIEPQYAFGQTGNSMQPSSDIRNGEMLVKYVYETLRNSSCWDKVMFIVTFDEHGGLFDHMPPGPTVPTGDDQRYANPTNGFNFDRLGVRVPALVISAYTQRGTIIGTANPDNPYVFDHTSVLATVEKRFGLAPLTQRDATARSLEIALNRATPRLLPSEAPTSLPAVAPDTVASVPRVAESSSTLSEGTQSQIRLALALELATSDKTEHASLRARYEKIVDGDAAAKYIKEVDERILEHKSHQ